MNLPLLLLAALLASTPALAEECEIPSALALCRGCHELRPGQPSARKGPNISTVYGAKALVVSDYNYSDAIRAAAEKGLAWTDDALFQYLGDQAGFLTSVNGKTLYNAMNTTMFKDPDRRREAIEGLKQLRACTSNR